MLQLPGSDCRLKAIEPMQRGLHGSPGKKAEEDRSPHQYPRRPPAEPHQQPETKEDSEHVLDGQKIGRELAWAENGTGQRSILDSAVERFVTMPQSLT